MLRYLVRVVLKLPGFSLISIRDRYLLCFSEEKEGEMVEYRMGIVFYLLFINIIGKEEHGRTMEGMIRKEKKKMGLRRIKGYHITSHFYLHGGVKGTTFAACFDSWANFTGRPCFIISMNNSLTPQFYNDEVRK